MRIEDVVLVAAIREDVRKSVFSKMGTAEVTQVVQAALAGKFPRNEGNRGADKQITSSTAAALTTGANQEDGTQNSGDKLFVSSGLVGL